MDAVAAGFVPPLRDAVLAGGFFGRAGAAVAPRLAEWLAEWPTADASLAAWFGPAADAMPADAARGALDRDIAAIDALIATQVDAILHAPRMTQLEGRWRGLLWLARQIDASSRMRLRVLNLGWPELCRDLARAVEFDQSNLFRRIYEDEFGMPGGEPFGLLLVDHEVKHLPGPGSDDVSAIAQLSAVAAAAFVPVVLAASPDLLEVDNFAELAGSMVPAAPLRAPSHARWRALGQREDMRFVCVTLPRVLARTPWLDDPGRHDGFRYAEYAPDAASRVWMTAGYAFASCVARAYAGHAWPADVRGVERDREGGGVVLGLPVEPFATDPGHTWVRPSLDLVLTDAQERDLVDAGLMPLCAVPFGPESAFSAVQSLQSPVRRTGAAANANAHMSAQINSMLCVSRFAHYIKVIGRDMVGSMATADEIERRLQDWLSPYVNGNVIASRDNRARHPLVSGRVLLAELLLFTGNVERADVILDAATDIAPDAALVVAEFRQLLRAELARRQLYRDGRVPEFLGDPTAAQSAALGLLVACRAGDMADAAQFAEAAEAARPRVPGHAAGMPFDDFRDADDLSSTSFEVLTTTGKYFWIPVKRVESIEFHPPKRPRNLYWRRASMSVRNGPDGDVYLPVVYASDDAALPDTLRLGRETDWRQQDAGPVRGVGQREFLVGEQAHGILELTELSFGP